MLPANVNHFAMPRLQLLQPRAAQSEPEPEPESHPHPHPLERQTAAPTMTPYDWALRPLTLHKFSSKPTTTDKSLSHSADQFRHHQPGWQQATTDVESKTETETGKETQTDKWHSIATALERASGKSSSSSSRSRGSPKANNKSLEERQGRHRVWIDFRAIPFELEGEWIG